MLFNNANPAQSCLHQSLLQYRVGTQLLTPPSHQALLKADPILQSHPGKWQWWAHWVIGIVVVRYMKRDGIVVRNSSGPVVEILAGKRREDAVDPTGSVFRGPCENNFASYWDIPTAYVEPNHRTAEDTLVVKMAEDLGLPAKHIVGCCGDICWESQLGGLNRKVRQIMYVVTTMSDGIEPKVPEPREYSEFKWIQLEHLETRHGVPMTGMARQALREAFRFAEMYQLE